MPLGGDDVVCERVQVPSESLLLALSSSTIQTGDVGKYALRMTMQLFSFKFLQSLQGALEGGRVLTQDMERRSSKRSLTTIIGVVSVLPR